VARAVGYGHRGRAHRALSRTLSDREVEGVDELRAVELARLDRLQVSIWEQAVGGDTRRRGMPIGPAFSLEGSQGMPIAGRGLLIVNSLSQSCGVAAQDGKNKSVWASFEMRPRTVS